MKESASTKKAGKRVTLPHLPSNAVVVVDGSCHIRSISPEAQELLHLPSTENNSVDIKDVFCKNCPNLSHDSDNAHLLCGQCPVLKAIELTIGEGVECHNIALPIQPVNAVSSISTLTASTSRIESESGGLAVIKLDPNPLSAQEAHDPCKTLFRKSPIPMLLIDATTGIIQDANEALANYLGYNLAELIGIRAQLLQPTEPDPVLSQDRLIQAKDTRVVRIRMQSGESRSVALTSLTTPSDTGTLICAVLQDALSEQLRLEERQTTQDLLQLLNTEGSMQDLMQTVTLFLRTWSGCEAVGIRLKKGYDFPFYATTGFDPDFVRQENRLCSYIENDEIDFDDEGNPRMECICGQLLSRKCSKRQAFLTNRGNFWTNSLSVLASHLNTEDVPDRLRGRCIEVGFQSVAIIKLTQGDEPIGLLHLVDHQQNRFSPERIAFLEQLADQISVAVALRLSLADLEENERRLRLIVQAAKIGLWDWDAKTDSLHLSPEYCSLLGYQEDELPRSSEQWKELVHPDDLPRTLERIRRFMNSQNSTHQSEFRLRHKDGSYRWLLSQASANRDEVGTISRMLGCHVDITDAHAIEIALRENESLLRAAQQQAHLGHFVFDLGSSTWTCAEAVDAILGIGSQHSKTYNSWFDLISPKYRSPVQHAFEVELLQKRKPFDKTYPIRRCDSGKVRWVHCKAQVMLDAANQPLKIIGILQDVTDRKLAEQRIRKLNETLEKRVRQRTSQFQEANQELEAFAYSISHDLRAPLRAIDGFAHILIEDHIDKLSTEAKGYFESISRNTRRMGQLIDDLLTFSRIGRGDITHSIVDMRHLVDSVLSEMLSDNNQTAVRIEIGELPTILGDPILLRQVWQNLISNAIKFSSKKSEPVIQIGSQADRHDVTYWIEDNGAGFDMSYTDRMFGVFQRLHSSSDFEGTGVGLAIVHRIITRHGGRVWSEGQEGVGAKLSFILPIDPIR